MRSRVLAFVLLCASVAFGQTVVSDTILRPDNSAAVGTVKISWPAFTTTSLVNVSAGSTTLTLGVGGSISVALQPTVGATPSGTLYTVTYFLSDGLTSTEYWNVPATGSTTVSVVRSSAAPYTLLAGSGLGVIEFSDWDQSLCVDGQIPKKISGAWTCGTDNTGAGGVLSDPGANGIVARTASGSTAARSLTAGSTKVNVTNGDGVSGNPTVDIVDGNLLINWGQLTGKPTNFQADWNTTVINKPTTWDYSQIANKPATFPSDWNTTANKPTTFTPSAHTHLVADITDFPATWDWNQLSNVPDTFPPSAHSHVIADITDLKKALANGVPSLDANVKVVQDPASAATAGGPNAIPKAGTGGTIDPSFFPTPTRTARGVVFISGTGCGSGNHVYDIDQVTGELKCNADSIPSGGYTQIQNAGTNVTQRGTLNFSGTGISVADNAGSTRTDVTFDYTAFSSTTGLLNKVPLGNASNKLDSTWLPFADATHVGAFMTKDCTGIGFIQKANADGTFTCAAGGAGGGSTVSVNGTAVTNGGANLNDTTPSASGKLLVKWQRDTSTPNNVSGYIAPPGSDQYVPFNDGGNWGTVSGFKFDKVAGNLYIPGQLVIGTAYTVDTTFPGSPMATAATGHLIFGADSDGKFKVSLAGVAPKEPLYNSVYQPDWNQATTTASDYIKNKPTIPSAVTFKTNGVNNGSQTVLNLKAGSSITVTDNGSGDVTIASSASAGYNTVQNQATNLTQRNVLNMQGPGVTCADNAAQTRTDCTISGSGGGGGSPNYAQSFTSQTSVTMLGASHGLGTKNLIVACYDNSAPAKRIEPAIYTVNATTFDIAVTFQSAQSGYCAVNGSGGSSGGTSNIADLDCSNYANIQACHDALPSTGGRMTLPGGNTATCNLLISKDHVEIVGRGGFDGSALRCATANQSVVTVTGDASFLHDFRVEHITNQPTAGGDGLVISAGDNHLIRNIHAVKNYRGIVLGSAAWGRAEDNLSSRNESHGFDFVFDSSQQEQWKLINNLSQQNNGYGYHLVNASGVQRTCPRWQGDHSYSNALGGWIVQATSPSGIANCSLNEITASTDNGDEIKIDSGAGGRGHSVKAHLVELAGQSSGVAMGWAGTSSTATNTGYGVWVTNNNSSTSPMGTVEGRFTNNSFSGVRIDSPGYSVSGRFWGNGAATTANSYERAGVAIRANDSPVDHGVFVDDTAGNMLYGIDFSNSPTRCPVGANSFTSALSAAIHGSCTSAVNTGLNADQVDGATLSIDGTLAGNSDSLVPSQKAVRTYVAAHALSKYSASFTGQTTLTVTGATHGLGRADVNVIVWDNSSPRHIVQPADVTINSSTFDVVVTFTVSQSGTIVIQ
jgi:hypothetical protein